MQTQKKCCDCKKRKNIEEFAKKGKKKDGSIARNSYCGPCESKRRKMYYKKNQEIVLNRVHKRRDKLAYELQYLKSKLKCQECGESDPRCLDFHHIDPTTKTNQVPELWHKATKQDAQKEMEKCEVLCANCHRKHHHKLYITDQQVAEKYPMIGEDI
jgi:hypothetical protein